MFRKREASCSMYNEKYASIVGLLFLMRWKTGSTDCCLLLFMFSTSRSWTRMHCSQLNQSAAGENGVIATIVDCLKPQSNHAQYERTQSHVSSLVLRCNTQRKYMRISQAQGTTRPLRRTVRCTTKLDLMAERLYHIDFQWT